MAIQALLARLSGRPAAEWLESGQALVLKQDIEGASSVLQAALACYRDDSELRLALAGVRWQLKDYAGAQALLDELLERQPDHVAAGFTLARLHVEQDRLHAAEAVLRALFGRFRQPADLVLRAARMLADGGRKRAAAELCEAAIAVGSGDPGLHVYAAALQGQLGEFGRSRGALPVRARP